MGISSICVDIASIRKLLEVIGGDIRPSENKETWLYRIAEDVGLEYRVIRAVWHGERVSRETAFKLIKAAKRNEYLNRNIAERLEWRAAVLMEIDPDFYRAEAETYRDLANRIRNLQGGEGET